MEKTKKIIDVIAIAIFVIIFGGYGVLNVVKKKKSENKENRTLAEIPDFSFTKSYFNDFESYFNDHFLYRNRVIAEHSKFKINTFKSSPFPDKALFGNNGFLFMNTKEAYDSYSNTNLLSEEKLSIVIDTFVNRKNRLQKRGVNYYFGYYPNKHTVYFENLPLVMQKQKVQERSLADQLKEGLHSKGFIFFDPKNTLLNYKENELLYLQLDSHWNSTGSYYAYVQFFETYKELGVKPLFLDNFSKRFVKQPWGDLTRLMGTDTINDYQEKRPLYQLENKEYTYTSEPVDDLPKRAIRTLNKNDVDNRKVLFFGDSYSYYCIQFLSLHFKEVIYLRDEYNEEMVKSLQPDVVIQMSVERFLYKHL